jgi:hypothetical protein
MPKPLKRVGRALWDVSLYTLSIPERYLRGLTALTGGMLKETTDLVLPDFVRDTTSYNIFVGNLLRFAVENVGGVEGLYDEEGLEGEFATRKVLGNAIEGIGIATVHVSPLWIFAFFADSLMKSGVSKSGSPKLNAIISYPSAFSSRLILAIARVADSARRFNLSETSFILMYFSAGKDKISF